MPTYQEIMMWAVAEMRGRGISAAGHVYERFPKREGEGLLGEIHTDDVSVFVINLRQKGPFLLIVHAHDRAPMEHVYMVCEHRQGISLVGTLGTASCAVSG